MTLFLLVDVECDDSNANELKEAFLKTRDLVLRNEANTLFYELTQDQNKPSKYIIVEVYTDKKSLREHSSQNYVQAVIKDLKRLSNDNMKLTKLAPLSANAERIKAKITLARANLSADIRCVTALFKINSDPEKVELFKELTLKQMEEVYRNEPDAYIYECCHMEKPDEFMFIEFYKNDKVIKEHASTSYFTRFFDSLKNERLFTEEPVITVFNLIARSKI